MNRQETKLLVENWRNLISVENHLEHNTIFLSESVLNEGMMEKIKSLGPKAAGLAFAMALLNPFNSGEANANDNNSGKAGVHYDIPQDQITNVMSKYLKEMGIKKFELKIENGQLLLRLPNTVASYVASQFSDRNIDAPQEGKFYVMSDNIENITARQLKDLAATASGIDQFGVGDNYDTRNLFDSDQSIIDEIKKLGSQEIEKRLDRHFKEDKEKFDGHKERQYNRGFDRAGEYFISVDENQRKDIIKKHGSQTLFQIHTGMFDANLFHILDQ